MEITTEKILREEIKELTAELDEVKGDLEMAQEKMRIAQGTAMERKKKIEKLEKQLEEVDVDFMRVVHAREVEQLREILDACEAANYKHLARIDQLEQLCRDLYHAAWKHKCFAPNEDNSGNCINPEQDCEHCQWWKPSFERRMEQLGLLDGEQND